MTTPGPARTRPRDRGDQILAAAARCFWEAGYQQTGMADIAAAVGIGASAVYRHFPGKQELLVAVLHAAVDLIADGHDDLDARIAALTGLALEHREFTALWDREGGRLPGDTREPIRARLRASLARTAVLVGDDPEPALLRAHAVHAVLGSPSYHHIELTAPGHRRLLIRAAHAVAGTDLPPAAVTRPPALPERTRQPLASRREALLGAAIRLFDRHGYPSVSMADIGALAGVTGSGVYKHFASKDDLLLSALNRGNEALWLALHHALASTAGPLDALDAALASYVDFAVANPEIVSILLVETVHLTAPQRDRYRRLQQEYVAEWVALLRRARPELDEPTARLTVHAALAVTNTLARVDALRADPGLAAQISALGKAVLSVPA